MPLASSVPLSLVISRGSNLRSLFAKLNSSKPSGLKTAGISRTRVSTARFAAGGPKR